MERLTEQPTVRGAPDAQPMEGRTFQPARVYKELQMRRRTLLGVFGHNHNKSMQKLCLFVFGLGWLFWLNVFAGEPSERVVVIAHRANHEAAHENTLEAIRNAISIGADSVELDVRRTKDGRHVLMHDRTVQRMTGASGSVNTLTLAEIRALNVSDPTRPNLPASKVPTFEEALDEIGSNIGLYLDFKDGDPTVLAAELRKRDQIKRTVVYLGVDQMEAWKKAQSGIRFIVSIPGKNLTPERIKSFLKLYPDVVLDGPITEYNSELVRVAHTMRAKVWPDIQNPAENEDQWSRALRMGVDGLQTDHPSALLAFLKKIGRH
jgi:glycerophosphoryl diester phosphodiesterase